MNITFFIGNGFDLNLGLKTSYIDFYKKYVPKMKDDLIAEKINENISLWSDLELGLAHLVDGLEVEKVDDFFDSKISLESGLNNYLENEQEKFKILNEDNLANEFKEKVIGFYKEFNDIEKSNYKNIIDSTTERIKYSFVTFNYTNTLDRIIDIVKKKHLNLRHNANRYNYEDYIDTPLHIHGVLNDDMILGINSMDQISNPTYKDNQELARLMVKPNINKELGRRRNEILMNTIMGSRYICLFGLSIGDTDQVWWSEIVKWLDNNTKNRLVIYARSETQALIGSTFLIRMIDKQRKNFIDKSKCGQNIESKITGQIIVIFNSKIFTFDSVGLYDEDSNKLNAKEAI